MEKDLLNGAGVRDAPALPLVSLLNLSTGVATRVLLGGSAIAITTPGGIVNPGINLLLITTHN